MLSWGLDPLSPQTILFGAFLFCALFALATGTSFGAFLGGKASRCPTPRTRSPRSPPAFQATLEQNFTLSPVAMVPPLLQIVAAMLHVSPLPTLALVAGAVIVSARWHRLAEAGHGIWPSRADQRDLRGP
jgi:Na+/H+ antiporter NhaC